MELRIRWAVTISFVFHILLLAIFVWSSVYFSSTRISNNLQAIQVSLVREKILRKLHPHKEKIQKVHIKKIKDRKPSMNIKSVPRMAHKSSTIRKIQAVKKVRQPKRPVEKKAHHKDKLRTKVALAKKTRVHHKMKPTKTNSKKKLKPEKANTPANIRPLKQPSPQPVKEASKDSGKSPSHVPLREAKVEKKIISIPGPYGNLEVEDMEFRYDYYLNLIKSKIDSRWDQPVAYKNPKQVLVEFIIRRNGMIDNIHVKESSGDFFFDQTALRAVRLSNPFPPLPRGYKEDFLRVKYRFIFGGEG